ncbi:MAG: hypothetical protein ACI35O_13330 [Bacillaceae bacterium]
MKRVMISVAIIFLLVGCAPKKASKLVEFWADGMYMSETFEIWIQTNLPIGSKITVTLSDRKMNKVITSKVAEVMNEKTSNIKMAKVKIPYPKKTLIQEGTERYEITALFDSTTQSKAIKNVYGEHGEYIKKGSKGRVVTKTEGKEIVSLQLKGMLEKVTEETGEVDNGYFLLNPM